MNVLKHAFWIGVFLFLYSYSLTASENERPDTPQFLVRATGNLLTLKAIEIALEKVLTELVNQIGIHVILHGQFEETLSVYRISAAESD